MFRYNRNDFIIGDDKLLENPTFDANNTNTSRSALHRAADSIAHACLVFFFFTERMNFESFFAENYLFFCLQNWPKKY